MSDRDPALAETAVSPRGVEVSPGIAGVERTATIAATSPDGIAALSAGNRQLGRYRLERELGAGGMGIVHAAFDPELERRVAVKLILRATSDEARGRLLREARAMARLTHPNIVTIYEIGTDKGRDFVTMELIDGGSLSDWIRAAPRSTKEVLDAFIAAGRGLAAAHDAGIVHRDFKPHNVLRSTSGRIVVGDFGLATGLDTQVALADIALDQHTALTATGSWVGTPAYMAPEQWNGGTITPATDQFAFCVALWEALAGQRPYRGDTLEQLRDAVTRGPDKLVASAIPMRLRSVLKRGLDPDPAKRWPNMTTLLAALRPDRKKLYVIGAALAGLGLSASVIVLALTRGGTTEPAPREAAIELRAHNQQRIADLDELKAAQFGERIAAASMERAQREIEKSIRDTSKLELLGHIRRMASGEVTVPQEAIGKLVAELRSGGARLVPTMDEKQKMIGLKVYAIRPASLLNAIGLSNGDVLAAIDHRPLDSEKALAAILEDIDSDDDHVEFEIIRNKQRIAIVVAAKDDESIPSVPLPSGLLEPPTPPVPPKVEVHVFGDE